MAFRPDQVPGAVFAGIGDALIRRGIVLIETLGEVRRLADVEAAVGVLKDVDPECCA